MKRCIKYLIIEDDLASTIILRKEMQKAGYTIKFTHIENGKKMKESLLEDEFDIVICDQNMPSFSSTEALKIRNEIIPKIPFIILANQKVEEIEPLAYKNKANAVLNKRNIVKLKLIINDLLNFD